MLPSGERLTSTEFARTFETGRHYRGPLLQLRIARRPVEIPAAGAKANIDAGAIRAAFVAGKKLGKAVVRNGLRRRIREQYRLSHWRQETALAGCDLVFMAAPAALTADSGQLRAALDELLERVKREHVKRDHVRCSGLASRVGANSAAEAAPQAAAGQGAAGQGAADRGQGRTFKRVWKQPARAASSNDGQSRHGSGDFASRKSGDGNTANGGSGTGDSGTGEQGRGQAEAE